MQGQAGLSAAAATKPAIVIPVHRHICRPRDTDVPLLIVTVGFAAAICSLGKRWIYNTSG